MKSPVFTLLAERYERRSILISSNLVFSQWDQIFKDPMTTMAAIDRLVHHSIILEFDGASQRARKAARRPKNRPPGSPPEIARAPWLRSGPRPAPPASAPPSAKARADGHATPPKPPLNPQGPQGSVLIVAKGNYNCRWTLVGLLAILALVAASRPRSPS